MTEIQLSNPFAESFEQYIILNAVAWQTRALVEIEPTIDPRLFLELESELMRFRPGMAFGQSREFHDAIDQFASDRYFVQQGSGKGKHLILCGAGPSLKKHAPKWIQEGDQVWGCNSAVTWLAKEGYPVTHGFTVDQTPHMYLEWREAPKDIEYLVATTIHPHLADLLINEGRSFRYFNNFVGIKKPTVGWPDHNGIERTMSYEEWMYALLFPGTIQAGSGLNTVTRALDVATYMDFDQITVLGADCSIQSKGRMPKGLKIGSPEQTEWLREKTVFHADGGHAMASESTPLVLEAVIDGRPWLTKIDLAISAQWIMKMAKASEGKIRIVGDVLPNAIKNKPDKWLRRLPSLIDSNGKTIEIPF